MHVRVEPSEEARVRSRSLLQCHLRTSKIQGCQSGRIGESPGLCLLPAERMDPCRARTPAGFIEEKNPGGIERVAVMEQTVAEQAEGRVGGEPGEQFAGGHQGIADALLPEATSGGRDRVAHVVARAGPCLVVLDTLVCGDKELTSLGIEDRGDAIQSAAVARVVNRRSRGCVHKVGGNHVERIHRNDLDGAGQVHGLGQRRRNAQAGEAAGADGDVDLGDLIGGMAEAAEQPANGGKDLGTVSQGSREHGFGQHLGAAGQRNGPDATTRFDR